MTWIATTILIGVLAAEVPVLRPGGDLEVAICESTPTFVTNAPAPRLVAGAARAATLALEIDVAGTYTLVAMGLALDTYLVLETEDGEVIAEDDDDGPLRCARIVRSLGPGRLRARVALLRGRTGVVTVRLTPGEPAPAESTAGDVAAARAAVRAAREAIPPDPGLLGDALHDLGDVLRPDSLVEAVDVLREAASLRSSSPGENDLRIVNTLLLLGKALDAVGRPTEAEATLRQGLLALSATGAATSLPAGLAHRNLGVALCSQDRHEDAERECREALQILNAGLPADHDHVLDAINDIGLEFLHQGRPADAEPLFRDCIARGHHIYAERNLGIALREMQRCVEAEPWLRRALAGLEARYGGSHARTIRVATDLGYTLRLLGRYGEAELLHRRALEFHEAEDGVRAVSVADALVEIGICQNGLLRHDDAVATLERAVAIRAEHGRIEDRNGATNLANLGTALLGAGDLDAAEACFGQSLRIREGILDPTDPELAFCHVDLGAVRLEQGELAAAEASFRRSLEIRRAALPACHPDIAVSLQALNMTLWSMGRFHQSEAPSREAYDIRRESLGVEHPLTRASLAWVVYAAMRSGRFAEASDLAEARVEGAIAHSWRELAFRGEESRFVLAADLLASIDDYHDVSAQGPDPSFDPVWERLTAWKGILYRAGRRSRVASGELEDSQARLSASSARLSALAYAREISDLELHRQRFAAARAEHDRIEREFFTEIALDPGSERTTAAELSVLLPAGNALLDFTSHQGVRFGRLEGDELVGATGRLPPHLWCWIVRSGERNVVPIDLGPLTDAQALIGDVLREFAGGRRGEPPPVDGETIEEAFHDRFFSRIEAHLDGVTRLFVSPDDIVAELPFEAIRLESGRRLIEFVPVVYVQDPVTLRDALASPPPARNDAGTLVAVGGVDFDAGGELVARNEPPAKDRVFQLPLARLPRTASEVVAVADLHRRAYPDAHRTVLVGPDPTDDRVKRDAPSATVLHIATHGFFERRGLRSLWQRAYERAHEGMMEAPGFGAAPNGGHAALSTEPDGVPPALLTGLALAGVNRIGEDRDSDGVLTGEEVSQLNLSACGLVVLSACETSLGQRRTGEGLMSMRRAFQDAGAKSVVSTLWLVDDAAAEILVTEFYRQLWLQNRSRAEALRNAQLFLLHHTELTHPRYWAAFTLTGEWR